MKQFSSLSIFHFLSFSHARMQPVSLKFRIKTNQGIVNKCDHVQSMLDDDCKENISYELNSKLVNFCCEICLKHLKAIMETTIKTLPLPLSSTCQMPLVSISVVDTDINLNICMCKERGDEVMSEKENICPNCRNIIKAQPSERYSLVSKQTMLGDVLVNRIDSQFLSSTYSSSQSQVKKLIDPYTPESIESHSPQTEFEEPTFINTTTDCDDILVNLREANNIKTELSNGEFDSDETEKIQNHHHNQMVSPLQLSTRLEILRRESQLDCNSKKSGSDGSHTKSSKSCCKCIIS